jgi:hypothetical protein
MKNSHLTLFFAVLLIHILPFHAEAQDALQSSPRLFHRIGDWLKSNALELGIAFIGGLIAKSGWTLTIKAFARKGAVITKEVGEFFTDSSTFLIAVNNAIKDDGSIEQNNIDDAIAAGKEVIAEGKDVIISIRPKI